MHYSALSINTGKGLQSWLKGLQRKKKFLQRLYKKLLKSIQITIFTFEEKKAQRLCFDYIKKAIDRYLEPHGVTLVPIEETIEPEDIDVHYQEYYQPDEIIRVEDILVDADSILPEDHTAYKEIETYIDKMLAQLPADWREAFILHTREDVPVGAIAVNKGRSIKEINDAIENAQAFLREKLRDTGFSLRK
jgi:DNA-directed RNA polymerase specialized sigma24 family protein